MKILAGKFKGRVLRQPKDRRVRPMADKVRAALFNILGDIDGLTVLDAYAGSGAVGFEALSRGAALVEAVELASPVARVIEQNAIDLEVGDSYRLWSLPIERFLVNPELKATFDVIIADPPYAQLDSTLLDLLAKLLQPNGLLVVSHSSRKAPPALESLELIQSKVYGDSALSFYRR
jgi:16S rRNA (guanine966-N2)-methyltransferase